MPTTRDEDPGQSEAATTEANGPQVCQQCGCERGQRASGDNGDGVWFLAWVCQCECHAVEDDPPYHWD